MEEEPEFVAHWTPGLRVTRTKTSGNFIKRREGILAILSCYGKWIWSRKAVNDGPGTSERERESAVFNAIFAILVSYIAVKVGFRRLFVPHIRDCSMRIASKAGQSSVAAQSS